MFLGLCHHRPSHPGVKNLLKLSPSDHGKQNYRDFLRTYCFLFTLWPGEDVFGVS